MRLLAVACIRRELAATTSNMAAEDEPAQLLMCYMPLLVQALKFDDPCSSPVFALLLERATLAGALASFVRNDLYWALTVASEDERYKSLYGRARDRLLLRVGAKLGEDTAEQLLRGHELAVQLAQAARSADEVARLGDLELAERRLVDEL